MPRHPLCALFSLTLHFLSFVLEICYFIIILFTFQRSLFERTNSFKTRYDFLIKPLSVLFNLFVFLLRKEVIHPHVPVGIPCYDLTPITCPTLDGSLLAVRPPVLGITNFRGLTGGVYKARERIHRDMLIRDY